MAARGLRPSRRTLLAAALTVGAAGVAWHHRYWIPTRGIYNPCLGPALPASLADHPAIIGALEGLELNQVWDCHAHLLGVGDGRAADVWVNPMMDDPLHPIRMAQKSLYMNASCPARADTVDAGFVARLLTLLEAIPGVRLMVMAFDYHHDARGQPQPATSTYRVSNEYAQAIAARHERLEWICSVHPYREDALEALRWCAEHGARAVKWLPPAMGMDPSSPRCDRFYDALVDLDMPLLSHGGDELAVQGEDHQHLGNPLLLRRPLDRGVRVIVAHCASLGVGLNLRRGEKSATRVRNFELWLSMMAEPAWEQLLFGEISATTQINRAAEALPALLENDWLHHRLLNGSDYPLAGVPPLFSVAQLVDLGLIDRAAALTIFELQGYNPFLFDLIVKRNLSHRGQRFAGSVFETGRFFGAPTTGLPSA